MLLTRRTTAISCALIAFAAACTATVTPTAERAVGSTEAQPVRATMPAQTLDWEPCRDGFECTTVTVPLDWYDDTDDTIELAVIRLPATGDDRIGSLLVNPGGPGEPGVDFLAQFSDIGELPDAVTERFDLVSWDPRGTGASSGITCGTDEDLLDDEPLPLPPAGSERDEVVAEAEADIAECLADNADVVDYVGTRQTVHDLDALRQVLGDDQLSYVGFSYGTSIGIEYLQEHPDKVRAIVLDGVVVPGEDAIAATHRQIASFENNLERFLDDCASRTDCAFGNGDPRGALQAFLDDLASGTRLPASYQLPDDSGDIHTREGTVGLSEAYQGILLTLYSRDSWTYLEHALADAMDARDPDAMYLLVFRDQFAGRELDGTWSHSTEARLAINCADQVERATSAFGDLDRVAEWSAEMPFFGQIGALGLPGCYRWPAARWPVATPTAQTLAAAPPVLLVNALHDSATPYANAEHIASLLPHQVLVTVDSEDHTTFGQGNGCVDDVVADYLITGELPDGEVRCDAE